LEEDFTTDSEPFCVSKCITDISYSCRINTMVPILLLLGFVLFILGLQKVQIDAVGIVSLHGIWWKCGNSHEWFAIFSSVSVLRLHR